MGASSNAIPASAAKNAATRAAAPKPRGTCQRCSQPTAGVSDTAKRSPRNAATKIDRLIKMNRRKTPTLRKIDANRKGDPPAACHEPAAASSFMPLMMHQASRGSRQLQRHLHHRLPESEPPEERLCRVVRRGGPEDHARRAALAQPVDRHLHQLRPDARLPRIVIDREVVDET